MESDDLCTPTTNRRQLLSTALLASTCGCSRLRLGETAELVDTFEYATDRKLMSAQPELSMSGDSWVTHTVDPNRADELFPWEDLLDRLGNAAPRLGGHDSFDYGERCVVFVVFSARDEEIEPFEQSDADMFDTGKIRLDSLTFTDIDIHDYQYVGSVWELGDVSVPDGFSVRVQSD